MDQRSRACHNGLDTFSVIIDNDDSIDSIASLNTNATIDALTVGIGDQLKLNNNFSLRIENSIANNGIIALTDNGISSPTTLEINETVSYSGNGVFENTFTTQNRIVGTGVLPTLINQTDLILNSGRMSLDSLTIENQGSLQANDGTLLTIDGITHIKGGEINAAGSGDVQTASGVTVENVTIGHLRVLNNRVMNVLGDLTIDGHLRLEDNGLTTVTALELDGAVNYHGAGTFETTNNLQNRILGKVGASLTINDNLNVTGINGAHGGLQISGFDVTNNASIVADNARIRIGEATYANDAGTFSAINNSDIELDTGITINGGHLMSDATSRFVALGGSGIVLDDVSLDAGFEFVIAGNTSVDLFTAFVNNGTVKLQDNGLSILTRLVVNGTVDYSGTGNFSNTNNLQNRLVGADASATLNNATDIELNVGQLLIEDITVNNQAKIVADKTTESTVNLRIDNSVINNLAPMSGLQALNGASIELGTGIINGGFVTSSNGGSFKVLGDSAWNGVELTTGSDVFVLNNNSVTLSNSFVNNGQISLQDNGLSIITALHVDGSVDYSGSGVINANNNAQNRLAGIDANSVLHNMTDLRLHSGQLRVDDLAIDNQGTITAGDGTILHLALNNVIDGGILTSIGSGVVRTTTGFGANTTLLKDVTIGTGGTLQIENNLAFRVQGGLTVDGQISITDNGLSNVSGLLLEGAVTYLGGNGHFAPSANFQNQITGAAGSTLSIDGDLNILGGGLTFDSLAATNNAHVIADGAGLRLQTSTISQVVSESGGEIAAINGGEIELGINLTIDGGVLSSDATSEIETQSSSAVLRDVNLSTGSFLRVNNNNRLSIEDSFQHDGTIHLNDNGLSVLTDVFIANDVSWSGEGIFDNSTNFQNRITGEAGAKLTLEAGQLALAGGSMLVTVDNFTNNALLSAQGGGFLDFHSAVNITNLTGSTLSGGTWQAKGNGSTLELSDATIVTNDAEVILSGVGSVIRGSVDVEQSLTNNTVSGALRVLENRDYTTTLGFVNAGVVELGGGVWNSNTLSNSPSAEIFGFGSITPQVSNDGLVRANGGTISAANGIVGSAGAIQIDADAGLENGAASSANTLAHNGSAADSLNLQAFDITVHGDYTNANFGEGNAFVSRAKVIGNGQILAAGDVAQHLSGDVSDGNTANAVLDFGNVHVGDLNTLNYRIANVGSVGPALRGALQTSVNGGSLNDARLGGSGVTAANFGPIGTGTESNDLGVVFDATSAGALVGQVVHAENNFDNVIGQDLTITGAAYRYANPVITPTTITLANVHVGDVSEQALNVLNDVPDDGFSEALNASFGINSGDAVNNVGTINLLGPSAVNNSALVAGINTSTAGAKVGTVTIDLVSDGSGSSELGLTNLSSQMVNVTGNVFRFASANASPDPIVLANVHIGDVSNQALTINNLAIADGFSESLNASFGGNSGDATNNGGQINLLAAASTDSTTLVAGIDTSSVGNKNGSVNVNFVSDGSGTSELGETNLAPQAISISGQVFGYAAAALDVSALDFVMRRGDPAVTKNLQVDNTATADGFHEGLDVSVQSLAAGYSASGLPITNLAAGADGSAVISLLGTTSGVFNGSLGLGLESNGAVSGLANTMLSQETVSLSGRVYETAVASVLPTSIDFGIVHVGDVNPTANISVMNNANGALNDRLRGEISTASNGYTAHGDLGDGVLAGNTNANSLTVALDTNTAGIFSGDAVLSLRSHNDELSDVSLSNESVTLLGQVNHYVNPVVSKVSGDGVFSVVGNTIELNFGEIELGSGPVEAVLGILNDVLGPADTLRGDFSFASSSANYSGFSAFTGVEAGETQNGFLVGIDALELGTISDIVTVQLFGFNVSGFEQALAPIQLSVTANIIAAPVPLPPAVWMLISGVLVVLRARPSSR